jgi:hypothetical protein
MLTCSMVSSCWIKPRAGNVVKFPSMRYCDRHSAALCGVLIAPMSSDAQGKRLQDVKQGFQVACRQAGSIVCTRREPEPEANYTKTRQYKKKGVNSSELTPLIS